MTLWLEAAVLLLFLNKLKCLTERWTNDMEQSFFRTMMANKHNIPESIAFLKHRSMSKKLKLRYLFFSWKKIDI